MPGFANPAIFQTRAGMPLANSTRAFFGSQGKRLYFIQVIKTAHHNPQPIGYQFASDRIAPKSFAPIYQGFYKYSVRSMTLETYENYAVWLRREQMKLAKAEEAADKRYEAAEAAFTMASIMLAPYWALGELLIVEKVLAVSQFLNHVMRTAYGDHAAWADVAEDVFDQLCKQFENVLPSWARMAVSLKPQLKVAYDAGRQCLVREVRPAIRPASPPKLRVPADDILDQCYRFRCIIDPSLPGQIRQMSQNIEKSVMAFNSRTSLSAY